MNESQRRAFAALAIGPAWRLRAREGGAAAAGGADLVAHDGDAATAGEATDAVAHEADGGADAATTIVEPSSAWRELREAVAACRACGLAASRTQVVFGVGDEQASWLFVGEAPGEEEDRLGEPFVGKAGRLLDRMLAALGLSRERDVFIANVLKCRPPHNRDPLPDERARCAQFLQRQIALVSPRVIVALGRVAAQALLQTETSLSGLRGKVHAYRLGDRSIPLVATYHPAYLLRTPADKSRAWADLCLARNVHASNPDA